MIVSYAATLISTQLGVCESSIVVQPPLMMVPIAPVPTTPTGKIFALLVFVTVPTAPVPTTPTTVNITAGVTACTAPVPATPVG